MNDTTHGIDFDGGDFEAHRFQQQTSRRRQDTLSDTADHTTAHQNVLHRGGWKGLSAMTILLRATQGVEGRGSMISSPKSVRRSSQSILLVPLDAGGGLQANTGHG